MKTLLKAEELLLFIFCIYLFSLTDYSWWLFPALLLLPDLSMIAYLLNPKIGAICYNLAHHKGIAIGFLVLGWHYALSAIALTGIILLAHSAMDRVFGYGLKYTDSFQHTHLGMLNRPNGQT